MEFRFVPPYVDLFRPEAERNFSGFCRYLPFRILFVPLFVAFFVLSPAQSFCEEKEIIGRVNDDPIFRSELQRLLDDPLEVARLRQSGVGGEVSDAELKRMGLEKIVADRLFLQEAERRGMSISEDEVDQALGSLRRRFATLEHFGIWMQERGLDDTSLLDTIRQGMLIRQVTADLVRDADVPDTEIREYFEARPEKIIVGEEVRLRIIFVNDQDIAEGILAALKKGEDFSRLAREKSLGMRASQGGDTGWIDTRSLPPHIEEAVRLLETGDVAGPLEKTENEYLLIGLDGRRQLAARDLNDARPVIEQRLLAVRQHDILQSWLAEQREQARIELFLEP